MFEINEILEHIKLSYGITVIEHSKLEGYGSINYKLKTSDGELYVLKIYLDQTQLNFGIAENEVLLAASSQTIDFPLPIRSKSNDHYQVLDGGVSYRLLSFLKGSFIAEIDHDETLLKSYGSQMAHSSTQLSNIYNTTIAAKADHWDLSNFLLNFPLLQCISNKQDRSLALYFFDQFESFVFKALMQLPKVMIQNDFNDWNVLVNENKVTGVIDFGDMAYAPKINHVAIGLFYILLSKDAPLETARLVLESYHEVDPLSKEEVNILYYLIAARAVTSVCNSAKAKMNAEDSDYISITEKPAWSFLKKWISINPTKAKNTFLKAIGFTPVASQEKHLLEQRKKYFSSAVSLSYKNPINMESAAFQYMYDSKGNTYLDAYNNIPIVGHSHPKVSEAISMQQKKLNTNTRYIYDGLTSYAEKLLAHFPPSFNKVFLVNSGSAANDLAARLAKSYNSHSEFVVMDHGYHGNTQIGIDISAYKFDGKGGQGKKSYIHKLEMPKMYLGKFNSVEEYILEAEDRLDKLSQEGKNIAGFFVEPIMGCGGQVPIPKAYIQSISAKIKAMGALVICDEVQIGFGRLGKWFWGFEMLDFLPDIVVLGKPMGNGHPIAAVVTHSNITERFETGMEYFSSFGGNPVSCMAANAVLEIIEEEELQNEALKTGTYFKERILEIAKSNNQIGDVRGEGLFLGIEIIDPISQSPDTIAANHIKHYIKENYILTSTDGPFNNVLKIKPPLCFSKQNVDQYCEYLSKALNNSKAF